MTQAPDQLAPPQTIGLDLRPGNGAVHRMESRKKQALETGRSRLLVAGVGFALAFFLVASRMVELAVAPLAREPSLAASQVGDRLDTGRAEILDRNGIVLATTLPMASLYADTAQIVYPEQAAQRLRTVLPELDQVRLTKTFASGKRFVWIKRKISPTKQFKVNRLGIPGLHFQREMTRIYPMGRLTAHLLGYTNIDNRGLAGIEQAFDKRLRESSVPLKISIDLRIQHLVAEELAAAKETFRAIGAAGLVMDANNGEVLASISLPSYNPYRPEDLTEDEIDRNSLGVYELGSIFKVLTLAMGIEEGVVRLTDAFDARKPLKIGGHTIDDFHAKRTVLTVPEVFIHSSNIGTALIASRVGGERLKGYLDELGMLETLEGTQLHTARPILPLRWQAVNVATIAFGHGIAVTPLHFAAAAAATVNGGYYYSPRFTLHDKPFEEVLEEGRQAFSRKTSEAMRWLMRLNVQKGSGRKAAVEGYLVGGKTGTPEKLIGGRYAKNRRMANFVAAFPMDRPRFLVLIMLDEPKPTKDTYGYATAGWVAAPVTGRLIARLAPLLGVDPAAKEASEIADRHLIPVVIGGD
ncbi:MAG: penicillin-binding protein 2 [Rhodospirillales bacterium]|nr:penicillin-binding protein 2 [Rhodospirillales bacterium]